MELIDREKLLKELKISADHHEENSRDYVLMLRDRNIVREQPIVDAQPVIHAEWKQINKNEVNIIPQWKCSECGAEFECFDMDFEYCPRCGAKMVEEQQGEDND